MRVPSFYSLQHVNGGGTVQSYSTEIVDTSPFYKPIKYQRT